MERISKSAFLAFCLFLIGIVCMTNFLMSWAPIIGILSVLSFHGASLAVLHVIESREEGEL